MIEDIHKRLPLRPIDARTIRLQDTDFVEEVNTRADIVRLYKQHSDVEIKVGSTIKFKTSPHKVNIITRCTSKGKIVAYDLKNSLLTNSSIFALPLLGGNRTLMLWDSLFVNAFISTKEYDRCIALLYRYSADNLFIKFESALCAFRTFIKQIEPDEYHTLFIFDIPEEAELSYNMFRQGKYSEIDGLWKLKILDYHGFTTQGKTGKILYKDYSLKKQLESKFDVELGENELHSIPDMKYEKFNPDYYKPTVVLK